MGSLSYICYIRHRDLRKPIESGIERMDSIAFFGGRDIDGGIDLRDHRMDIRSVAVRDLLVPMGESHVTADAANSERSSPPPRSPRRP